MITLLCALVAYLIGSLSFGIIASRWLGLPDPRTYGSGNPGATNVLRSGRKTAAIVTLIGDCAKGLVAVVVARHFATQSGAGEAAISATGVAVFLGHLYPLYFHFKGGKGVATALGVLLGFSPWLALLATAVFGVVVVVSRYVSLASVVAAVTSAVLALLMLGWGTMAGAVVLVAALVLWRHRDNLRRVMAGTERRLGFGSRDSPSAGGPG